MHQLLEWIGSQGYFQTLLNLNDEFTWTDPPEIVANRTAPVEEEPRSKLRQSLSVSAWWNEYIEAGKCLKSSLRHSESAAKWMVHYWNHRICYCRRSLWVLLLSSQVVCLFLFRFMPMYIKLHSKLYSSVDASLRNKFYKGMQSRTRIHALHSTLSVAELQDECLAFP